MSDMIRTTQTTGEAEAPASQPKEAEASLWGDAWRSLRKNPWFIMASVLLLLMIAMAAFPQLFTNWDPRDCPLARSNQEPSAEHWFGTDRQGCDYYSRVIYGARNSVAIGMIVAAGTLVIAVVFGLLAGYFGKWVDAVLFRFADMVFAIPYILGALVFLNIIESRGIWEVAGVLVVFMWPVQARLMRSSVLSVVNSEYVMAARALGASHLTIMRRHILPNSLGPVISYTTVFIGIVIAAEAVLTYLGVGLQLPAISWGLQLSDAQPHVETQTYLLFFPLIFVAITVFAFMALGDALSDALDPKSKKK